MPDGLPNGTFSTCSYVLRPLVQDVPLSTEDDADEDKITCVEVSGKDANLVTEL